MTPLFFVLIIAVAIVLLSVMTLVWKMHPVITLFVIATVIGLLTGHGVVETMGLIKHYFGSTLSGIGILIIFGAMISCGINDTGAATSIANFFIRLFRGKRLELAPSLTGFVMSIPVFGDIAMVLNAGISGILARRKHINMALMAPMISLGLSLTHGLVPPTPGILAVSIVLKAELGLVVFWGLVCSVISFVFCYIVLTPILRRGEFIEPLPEFTEGVQPVGENASIDELLIQEENVPSAGSAFIPLLLPAVMITVGSLANAIFSADDGSRDSVLYKIFVTIGDSTVALFVGILAVAWLTLDRKTKVIRKANEQSGSSYADSTPIVQIIFDNWVGRALKIAIGPLIITAMGGAMGGILRENTGVIKEIGGMVAASSIPNLMIPFLMAAVLMAVCGSMTTASMTAAALILPMLGDLGVSPVVASLSIGAGSMCFWHVNNSGFWVMTSLYNFNPKQGLKYLTTTNALGGAAAFAALALFVQLGWVS